MGGGGGWEVEVDGRWKYRCINPCILSNASILIRTHINIHLNFRNIAHYE